MHFAGMIPPKKEEAAESCCNSHRFGRVSHGFAISLFVALHSPYGSMWCSGVSKHGAWIRRCLGAQKHTSETQTYIMLMYIEIEHGRVHTSAVFFGWCLVGNEGSSTFIWVSLQLVPAFHLIPSHPGPTKHQFFFCFFGSDLCWERS